MSSILKGIKIKAKQQKEEEQFFKKVSLDDENQLNKRGPENGEAQTEEPSQLPFKKKYDFVGISMVADQEREKQTSQQNNDTWGAQTKESEEKAPQKVTVESFTSLVDSVWNDVLSNNLENANENLQKLDHDIFKVLHGNHSSSVFGVSNPFGTSNNNKNVESSGLKKEAHFTEGWLESSVNTIQAEDPAKSRQMKRAEIDHDYESAVIKLSKQRGVDDFDQFATREYEETYDPQKAEKEEADKLAKREGKAYLKKLVSRESKIVRREEKVLSSCRFCLANAVLKEVEILAISDNFYIMQPNESIFG